MNDENTPAFVLELEIDDEISFKPMKNKRALQLLDTNTVPLATPEKRRQIQKCQTSPRTCITSTTVDTPTMAASQRIATDDKTPLLMYSNQLENAHKPKYSQAEVDAHKLEWQKERDDALNDVSESVRGETAGLLGRLEAQCESLRLEKSILERQMLDLRATLFESRSDESSQVDQQVRVLSDQLRELKSQGELLEQQHSEEVAAMKNAHERRVSEMIKSHATSILAMQQRVTADVTAAWRQKLEVEQAASAALRASGQALARHVEQLGEQQAQAVREAKQKMFDKVTLQFEAGNLKYEALKTSYKESQDGLLAATGKITELKAAVAGLEEKEAQASAKAAAQETAMASVESGLRIVLDSLSVHGEESTDLSQEAVRRKVFEVLEREVASRGARVAAAEALAAELQAEASRLQQTATVTNTTLTAMHAEKDELQSSLEASKLALVAAGEELAGSRQERDAQMLVIANMIAEKGRLDADLERAEKQGREQSQRCDDLRKMNDEVMSMLEKMYAAGDKTEGE